MLEMDSAAEPGLLRGTGWAAVALPMGWLPNPRLEGETLIPAAAPVPLRLTV